MAHVDRLALLNDSRLINKIFIGRADLVSNKVDGYLEGIVFRYHDHDARIIHKALVKHLDDNLFGKHPDSCVQEQLKQVHL
ncbi:unnamed protein product [Rotaria sp. Silwood1]|nr:unnamed protein product [Rotaria sp. Silwood1]CAF0966777.1 unnamed protein product [Rotaria sp. Silwood1]CAF3405515.1 unnamed protein product [Rotaria sp. Silwood1]CAF4666377.1 unnamed protein product [Rotaria sp. Silwood1]